MAGKITEIIAFWDYYLGQPENIDKEIFWWLTTRIFFCIHKDSNQFIFKIPAFDISSIIVIIHLFLKVFLNSANGCFIQT